MMMEVTALILAEVEGKSQEYVDLMFTVYPISYDDRSTESETVI